MIGGGAVRREDRNQAVIGQANSRVRIDNVRGAAAIDIQPLKQVTRSGERPIGQPDEPCWWRVGDVQRGNLDSPTGLAGRWITHGHVAPARDESPCDATRGQDLKCFVQGITFGDAAQVQLHARDEQFHRVIAWIQPHLSVTHSFESLRETFSFGQALGPARASPQADGWPHRNIEGTVTLLRDLPRSIQNPPPAALTARRSTGSAGWGRG